ncbi:MAG: FIST N-terminal domain-containing protein [Myxococcota bacterium]|nr:FIST N-terminal domain-containing protein [Myxococcota bacterium]
MTTRLVTAHAQGDAAQAAATLVDSLRSQLDGASPALVMFFASTDQPVEALAPALTEAFADAAVLGSSTAGEFTERGDAKRSVVAVAVAGDFVVHGGLGTALAASADEAVKAAVEGIPATVEGYPHRTGLLLLDPLAGNGEEATLITAAYLGDDIRLAGGAAGDDLAMKRTVVSYGARAEDDAIVAAVVFSKAPLGVGVCHGHRPISEPLEVTRAEGGVVHEVEGRPAWEIWAEHTREAAAAVGLDPDTLGEDEVGGFLLRYEAGLASGDEYKIRAPLSRNPDGSLGMACGIPQGARIRITESVPERQIESARTAAKRARAQLGTDAAGAIVFDCICRNLILSERFEQAVAGISEELGGVPLAGFETYGEIALDAGDLSGFHNTTTVVLAFPG